MTELNDKQENLKYNLLLILHTMMMCTGFNYVTYYLLSAGVSDQKIGVLIAVSCTAAVLLQQVTGRMVDRGLCGAKILLLCLAAAEAASGVLVLLNKGGSAKACFFGILLCITLILQPLLSSISFFYQKYGVSVNYGIARGFGSLGFCACSVLLGFLTARVGAFVVPTMYVLLSAAFFAVMCFMPALQGEGQNTDGGNKKKSLQPSLYPAFMWMLVGLSLVMLCHNAIMTYFIHVIERVGGDSSNLGIAIGIAAVVEIPVLFLYTKIKKNRPSKVFLLISGITFFIKAVLFTLARNIWMIYAIQCLQFSAYGLMAASRVYYVDETIGKENEATGQAFMSATETVGIVLGSLIGGFLMNRGGVSALLYASSAAGFLGMMFMIVSVRRRD